MRVIDSPWAMRAWMRCPKIVFSWSKRSLGM